MEDPMGFAPIKYWSEDWGGEVDYLDFVNQHCDLPMLVALAGVFRPRFVEVEDCVLWDRAYKESNFRSWRAEYPADSRKIETTLNQLRVWDIVESEENAENQEALEFVAECVANTWTAALRASFPDRNFDVRVLPTDDGPVVTFSAARGSR